MIVFDLRCSGGHVFEAWFASGAAYDSQCAAALIACPICDDRTIGKAVMAPNVGAKGNRGAAPQDPSPAAAMKATIAGLAQAQAKALAQSEWVGMRFANRARAMHDGTEPHAPSTARRPARRQRRWPTTACRWRRCSYRWCRPKRAIDHSRTGLYRPARVPP